MRFTETPLAGAWLLELERHEDERGFFARTWCQDELERHGLDPCVSQCSVSRSHRRGTLRGLHLQIEPHAESKLVRCTAGRIFDVAVDLRPDSPTFRQWYGVELDAEAGNQLFVPAGFAHGFQTLADDSEVYYMISVPYAPDFQRGYRYDDPAFGIEWPEPVTAISERDRALPSFES